MIAKTEAEITKNWIENPDGRPTVSVHCMTYNQEGSIGDALDSMLMQETDFPFEIVVHDDASTDGTAAVIRRYEAAYPRIMRPIYEEENLFSRKDGQLRSVIAARISGRYVAFLEGDDVWTDPAKLQKQAAFMDSHPDCVMCTHNTVRHYLDGSRPDSLFNDWKEVHLLTEREIFFGWDVHTSSFMIKREQSVFPDEWGKYWFGDYIYLTHALACGNIYCLPDVMSRYNAHTANGVTILIQGGSREEYLARMMEKTDYLREYDTFTEGRFHGIVEEQIVSMEMFARMFSMDLDSAQTTEKAREAWAISRDPYFKQYLRDLPFRARWKTAVIYRGACLGRLWVWAMNRRAARKAPHAAGEEHV